MLETVFELLFKVGKRLRGEENGFGFRWAVTPKATGQEANRNHILSLSSGEAESSCRMYCMFHVLQTKPRVI